jgi:hypothetical protein
MFGSRAGAQAGVIGTFLVTHHHAPQECGTAFAAWQGFDSPLRRGTTLSSCRDGGHTLWWRVEAEDESAALALLPEWLAERSEVSPVREVEIP